LTFIALGLSAIVPIAHVVVAQGFKHARDATSLDLVVASGASYIVGALM
jgi:adiponectin receptor